MMNELIIKERIYLNAKKRHNIIRKNDGDDGTIKTTRQVKSFFILSSFRSRDSFPIKFLIVTVTL